MRVRERTLQAPQWATRIGCSPRAEKLIRADTTLDHSQKAERADKLIRPDTALDHTQKAESALSLYYGYYATTTITEGARRVDHQARPVYSPAGIDRRGLLIILGGPGGH